MAPTIFAPGIPQVMVQFDITSASLGSFLVSVFIVAFIFGPLFLTPLGEQYGRAPITHITNIMFVVFNIICAVSVDTGMLIVFRFLAGLMGCVAITLGGGFIADMMPPARRGTALTIWTIGPLLGPVIAPVIGGFLAMNKGWRWTFWLTAIIQGTFTICCLLFLHETYGPRLLQLKAKRLRKETGNANLRSKLDKGTTVASKIRTALIRPSKMLIRSPIALLMALYVSMVYGYMYILFTTFTEVFEGNYGFNTGEAGLAYLGLGFGFVIGQIAVGSFSDRYLARMKAKHGAHKPEDRLPPLVIGGFLVPVGLIWYGWSAEKHTHWIVPIIGTAFVGIGILAVFLPIQMYLIDTFNIYAASAIAANTVVRSIFGTVLPLAGPPMYARLGLGWGNTLLAFIALIFTPVPFLLLKYGERIRTNPRFQPQL